jgi:pyridoxine/pyridoxamine 5'-phosphate oxidase
MTTAERIASKHANKITDEFLRTAHRDGDLSITNWTREFHDRQRDELEDVIAAHLASIDLQGQPTAKTSLHADEEEREEALAERIEDAMYDILLEQLAERVAARKASIDLNPKD